MKYFVNNVSKTQYTSDAVTIKPDAEAEVGKDVYDYLNKVFGASGKFTFRTEGKTEKKPSKVKEVPTEKVEVPKTKKVETKVTTKSKK